MFPKLPPSLCFLPLGLAAGLAAAEPPPVLPGLWEVRLLTTYEALKLEGMFPVAAAPATAQPLARSYRICIGAERARAPMSPRNWPSQAEIVVDQRSVSAYFAERAADGRKSQTESLYRRLGDTAFEGSHDVEAAGQARRTQYFAHRLAPDCGDVAPSLAPITLGEP